MTILTATQMAAGHVLMCRFALKTSKPWASAMALDEARWSFFCESIVNGEPMEMARNAYWAWHCSVIRKHILDRVKAKRGRS